VSSMDKTLLVLAAAIYQIPAIETAKRLGYRVITSDNTPENPGHTLADASFGIDTTDVSGVLALARKERISGVIAPCTDVAVVTAAHVAEQLHLPGPPPSAACVLSRKYSFREFLRQAGFTCPRVFLVNGDDLPDRGLFDGRPWLLKPNRSSGSRGVFIVSTCDEFSAHLAESRAFSLDRTVILEEFIDGTQHTCEGVLQAGRIALGLLTDRDTAPKPYTATTGHRVPTRLPETIQRVALRTIEDVFARLHVASGPFDCDFVVSGEHIALIEIAPRVGGNSLSKLFKAALDFDFVAYAVTHACADPYALPEFRQPKPVSIAILGVEERGRLAWNAAEANALRQEAWMDNLTLDFPQGTPVERFINGRHRVGEALIIGNDRKDLDGRMAELRRRLALTAI
jgi:biotin carboxylase